ncbi:MAG: hypothetical protein ACHQWU_04945 [Gemmatimonadales bacterium]
MIEHDEKTPRVSPAGRLFGFSERCERSLVDGMRDLDEIMSATKELYPEHTWSRTDLLLFFFLDSAVDELTHIRSRGEDA